MMKRMFIFLLTMLLFVFLTGCGSGKPPGCCSIYETDDAVARELFERPGRWEEACDDVRAQNNVYGGRSYVRGLVLCS